jgi:hypothetical protein
MLKSTINVATAVVACLAIASIASTAGAAVEAGVVGGGIHMQYGPQDAGGNYLGIASESYDFYTDFGTGWGDSFPTWSGTQTPPDGIGYGYVLLAFNPYTGQVWSDIPVAHQALDPANSFTGHTPTVGLTGVDSGGNPIASDVVQYDSATYGTDCVYITGAFIPAPTGIVVSAFGSFVQTSSDGGILSTAGWPVYAGGSALMEPGDEVRNYAAGDPDRPDCFDPGDTGDLNFNQTKTWGYSAFWDEVWGYAGSNGGAADNLIGFEMDGKKGWMRLDFSAHRTGVRLTEYYFDVLTSGDFDGDGDVDSDDVDVLCANIGGDPATFDVDGDGDVDEDDMTFHVENYLEYDSDGDGTVDGAGTFRGDFNTDGSVNGTDLSIMSGSFGGAAGFASGNANCDATVNGTDLSILSGVFGNVATAAIPEPVTMTLLSLGGVTLLRRRSR